MGSSNIQRVLEKIDQYNAKDVHRVWTDGEEYPFEVLYAKRLTTWVTKLDPNASEALLIAARGQHIGRWEIPREDYPMDRGGYLRWRSDLKKFHADKTTDIMKEEKCPADLIDQVKKIVLKQDLSENRDSQTMEDALCLVFLETQFEAFKEKTNAEKLKNIIQKTWKKMSEQGRTMAVALNLPPDTKRILDHALKEI